MVRPVFLVLALLLVAAGQTCAQPILYSNGPINGEDRGNNIGIATGFAVSDSFTLANSSNLTGVQLGLYTYTHTFGSTPTSLQWSIGTTPFGSDQGSGTAGLTSTYQPALGGYTISSSTFPLSKQLRSGTYWLTLQNATTSDSVNYVYWDQSFGPSTAISLLPANTPLASAVIIPSESFQILGTVTTATPEPASITLLGIGIAGFAGYGWRVRAKTRSRNAACLIS